jgi:hypothetical protein
MLKGLLAFLGLFLFSKAIGFIYPAVNDEAAHGAGVLLGAKPEIHGAATGDASN